MLMGDRTNDLAMRRTEWAEDRTLLANERTFAAWLQAGITSVGLGLGFQALFKSVEPTWLAKTIATIFILIGVLVFISAFYNACDILRRMKSHSAKPLPRRNLGIITFLFVLGSTALTIVLWLL
ncbi:hypothetical protein GCM10011342_24150 [Aquisalinus flavus]|uniref:DUF202 domain-containing protein n=2 Tax=Aquisalinus flavus TaxID=1526572 RepID=A0A8J2V5P5_9PROT|nr:DUF202 domain-containing protein [Aquisalinus flavus]UNE48755.1 DUF202 domain-containing protein [Aquisalinus flavus]GGD14524.1 hypothetical protein GCM10011342_24150 [Aquisalinus flavus]